MASSATFSLNCSLRGGYLSLVSLPSPSSPRKIMEILGGASIGREIRWPSAIAATSAYSLDRARIGRVCVRGNFADEGHLRYYGSPVKCGGRKEEKMAVKRREKLIKGLIGLQAAGGLDLPAMAGGQVEDGERVADALVARLSLLKAEEKEMKKRRKEEKKMKKAACDESSTSSSSSEDDEDDMITKTKIKPETSSCAKSKNLCQSEDSSSSSSSSESDCENQMRQTVPEEKTNFKPKLGEARQEPAMAVIAATPTTVATTAERIEVCIGGKCKKSGAIELMEEFQRTVGEKAAVVGCKCLGKCKQAPNVRVRTATAEKAPICLGVGIQDVGAIVANLFTEEPDLGLNPA
ncbi:diacylglycerol acyltransferase isoform X2 [Wolffia australiana]